MLHTKAFIKNIWDIIMFAGHHQEDGEPTLLLVMEHYDQS